MKIFIIQIFLICLLIGCNLGFVHEEQITGNYYLIAVDIKEQMSVSYKLNNSSFIGVVPETVYAVGFNENFIIAEQHEGSGLNIKYYIIPLSNPIHSSPDENVIGPLNHDGFMQKRKELKIPENLNFSIFPKD
jgi:uncharacterized membrane protein YciS (DUF1049 family)